MALKLKDYLEAVNGDDFVSRGVTASTTFFHEILCGLFILDPNAQVKTGFDLIQYFQSKKIVPINAAEAVIDIMSLPQARFLVKSEKIDMKYINDAKNIASAFKAKAKIKAVKKILWTGPTNDSSKYGAADIVVFSGSDVYPISLKFGAGQLKNLSMNTIGSILEISLGDNGDDAIVGEILTLYKSEWDKMTIGWLKWLAKGIKTRFPKSDAAEIFTGIAKEYKTWDAFNSRPKSIPGIEKLYKKCGVPFKDNSVYRQFRKFCAKYYEVYHSSTEPNEWTDKIRRSGLENTIGTFFKSKEANFKRNVKGLFAAQLSIQQEDYWYLAKGGKTVELIPGQQRFEAGLKKLKVSYSFNDSGTGYIIPLFVEDKKGKLLMEIKIFFRWTVGQMFGNITTTSSKKVYVDDWTEFFI